MSQKLGGHTDVPRPASIKPGIMPTLVTMRATPADSILRESQREMPSTSLTVRWYFLASIQQVSASFQILSLIAGYT